MKLMRGAGTAAAASAAEMLGLVLMFLMASIDVADKGVRGGWRGGRKR